MTTEALKTHRRLKGKLEISPKIRVLTKEELSLAYTPGVAEPSREIAKEPEKVYDYTMKSNAVAIVTDGSAVLGLGNIGPEAALPVMEGKAVLFKEFADVDAFPICLKSQDSMEIIKTVRNISPAFGGVNLEDIAAPRCFEVEEALQDLGIPVFHDDQHGTAIVILAALINAAKAVGKNLEELKMVVNGAGAAGTAVTKLLLCLGIDRKICTSVKEIIVCDSKGIIYEGRPGLNKYKEELSRRTNPEKRKGGLSDAIKGADVFIGVSAGNLLKPGMIKEMAKDPIVFAMANPVPEIMPEDAKKAGAAVVGTGRSDFPNQINNVLAFPGVFRGALDARAAVVNNEMKLAAANALARCVDNPTKGKILPRPLERWVAMRIADAVKKAAIESGATKTEVKS